MELFVAHYHREIMFSGFSGCVMLSFGLEIIFKVIGHKFIA